MTRAESIRLEKFRQLKGEIRGSQEHLVVGIDVAKEKHHAFLGTANGKSLVRRLVFDNSREGFESLIHRAQAIMTQEGLTKVVYGLEPTADYHKPLGEFLVKSGYPVVLVSNGAVKQNRETLDGRWDKNDTKDSANVGDLISQGKGPRKNNFMVFDATLTWTVILDLPVWLHANRMNPLPGKDSAPRVFG